MLFICGYLFKAYLNCIGAGGNPIFAVLATLLFSRYLYPLSLCDKLPQSKYLYPTWMLHIDVYDTLSLWAVRCPIVFGVHIIESYDNKKNIDLLALLVIGLQLRIDLLNQRTYLMPMVISRKCLSLKQFYAFNLRQLILILLCRAPWTVSAMGEVWSNVSPTDMCLNPFPLPEAAFACQDGTLHVLDLDNCKPSVWRHQTLEAVQVFSSSCGEQTLINDKRVLCEYGECPLWVVCNLQVLWNCSCCFLVGHQVGNKCNCLHVRTSIVAFSCVCMDGCTL